MSDTFFSKEYLTKIKTTLSEIANELKDKKDERWHEIARAAGIFEVIITSYTAIKSIMWLAKKRYE